MAGDKSLLRSVEVRQSGRLHNCRRIPKHKLPLGATMLVVKEDRDERHYCVDCAERFIATAKQRLGAIEAELGESRA